MKKIIYYLLSISILATIFLVPKLVFAQSPIRCGLLGESCCTGLVGGDANPCQNGLVCSGGSCVVDPSAPDDSFVPTRGKITPSTSFSSDSPLKACGIDTAIGCIPLGEEGLATFFLRWGIGVGGGIAFLMIIFAGFQIMASQGNPDKLKAGQELLSAAIGGLMLLIFSVFILRFVGVTIFKIPDF